MKNSNHQVNGFHAKEMIVALQKMARNHGNGIKILKKMNRFNNFRMIISEGIYVALNRFLGESYKFWISQQKLLS